MKNFALGAAYEFRSIRPIIDSKFLLLTLFAFSISFIGSVYAVALSCGRATVKARVSIIHPSTIFLSSCVPSAIHF